jgi:hypothetical protein
MGLTRKIGGCGFQGTFYWKCSDFWEICWGDHLRSPINVTRKWVGEGKEPSRWTVTRITFLLLHPIFFFPILRWTLAQGTTNQNEDNMQEHVARLLVAANNMNFQLAMIQYSL